MATFPLLGLIASPAIPLTDSHLLGSYRQQGSPRPCLYMDSSLLLAMLGSQQGTSVQGLVPWFDFTLCAFVQLCAFSLPLVAPPRLSVLLAVANLIQLYSLVHRLLLGFFLFGGLIPCPCFFFLFQSISLDFCSGFSSSSIVQYMYQTLFEPWETTFDKAQDLQKPLWELRHAWNLGEVPQLCIMYALSLPSSNHLTTINRPPFLNFDPTDPTTDTINFLYPFVDFQHRNLTKATLFDSTWPPRPLQFPSISRIQFIQPWIPDMSRLDQFSCLWTRMVCQTESLLKKLWLTSIQHIPSSVS